MTSKRKRRRRAPAADPPPAPRHCPICDEETGDPCSRCGARRVPAWSALGTAGDELVLLRGRVVALPGDAPAQDGWRHAFDVSLEDQRRLAVETAPLLTRVLAPDGAPAAGVEVELLGEARTVFVADPGRDPLRDPPRRSLVLRARLLAFGPAGERRMSRAVRLREQAEFDRSIRKVECRCGAILSAPYTGGTVSCAECPRRAVTVPPRRPIEPRSGHGDGPDRVLFDGWPAALLRRLAEDLHAPLRRIYERADDAAAALGVLRRRWGEARERLYSSLDYTEELQAQALGEVLADACCFMEDFERARAVLETLLDRAHRWCDQLRCHLARAAALAGELQEGEAWLEETDPGSSHRCDHIARRVALALLTQHRRPEELEAAEEVLRLLDPGERFAPQRCDPLIHCLRAHAHAILDRSRLARHEIKVAAEQFGRLAVQVTWLTYAGPSTALL